MKKATRGLFALLAGELLVISQKDKKFARTLKKKKGIEKIKFIATTLFDFNKDIVEKTSEEIENIDFQETVEDMKDRAERQFALLQEKVDIFEEQLKSFTEDDIDAYLADIKKKYLSLKKTAKTISKDMTKKYALEEKIVAIKKHIDTIRSSLDS